MLYLSLVLTLRPSMHEINVCTFNIKNELETAIETNMRSVKNLTGRSKLSTEAEQEYYENLLEASDILKDYIEPIAATKLLTSDIIIELLHRGLDLKSKNNPSKMFVYGLCLCEKERRLIERVKNDYALFHFCYLLNKAILLQIGRTHFQTLKNQYANENLLRIAVLSNDNNGEAHQKKWSLAIIRRLLDELTCPSFPVQANEHFCLSPNFSLIGLAVTM